MSHPISFPFTNDTNDGEATPSTPSSDALELIRKRYRSSDEESTEPTPAFEATTDAQTQWSPPASPAFSPFLSPFKLPRAFSSPSLNENGQCSSSDQSIWTLTRPPVSQASVTNANNSDLSLGDLSIDTNTIGSADAKCKWEDCALAFSSKMLLLKHIQVDHAGISETSPRRVRGRHGGETRGFQCRWEGCMQPEAFNAWSHLYRHVKIHVDYRPFICEICAAAEKRAESANGLLKYHLQSTHQFSELRRLNEHKSLYHGIPSISRRRKEAALIPPRSKRHQHLLALQATSTTTLAATMPMVRARNHIPVSSLLIHDPAPSITLVTPTASTQPSSAMCPSASSLNRAAHSKALQCPIEGCTKIYVYKNRLEEHVEGVHMGINRWYCSVPGCGAKFPHSASLQRHQIKDHSSEEIRHAKDTFMLAGRAALRVGTPSSSSSFARGSSVASSPAPSFSLSETPLSPSPSMLSAMHQHSDAHHEKDYEQEVINSIQSAE